MKLGQSNPKGRYVNPNLFINPDNINSYVLGLLWGDGNLNNKSRSYQTSIELVSEDFCNIEHLFASSGKWYRQIRHRPNRKEQTKLSTSNIELYKYLSCFGYERKSILSPHVSRITSNQSYWWRGYFDADGCLYTNIKNSCYQVSIASTYEQDWLFAEELFNSLGCKHSISRRISSKSKSSIIRITNKLDCIKFLNYIYNGETFGLNRKYQKYLNLVAT